MAANDVLVTCFNPRYPENFNRAVTFHRRERKGLKWSSTSPGGDDRASWSVPCDILSNVGFPEGRSRVIIWDPTRSPQAYHWRGILAIPAPTHERGRLSEVEFTALGVYRASRHFPDPTVLGPGITAATVNTTYRQTVANLGDIMKFGLRYADLVDGTQANVAVGGPVLTDTSDYRGRYPQQLWQDVCNLTAIDDNPFIWLVEPDFTGRASLVFEAQPTQATYWENADSKTNKLEVDFMEIANQIYVAFQGSDTIQVPPVGTALDYSQTPDIQTHFVEVSETLKNLQDAQGFAGNLYNKFNRRLVTGGSIVLDRNFRSIESGAPRMVPITDARAGRVIQVRITKLPWFFDVILNIYIAQAEYDEENCEVTLQASAMNQAGKDARYLAMLANRNSMTWALASTQLGDSIPNLYDILKGTPYPQGDKGFFGEYFDPNRVAVPSVFPTSWGTSSPSIGVVSGSSLPRPVTEPPPGGVALEVTNEPITVAKAKEGALLGTMGRKVVPQELPDHRVNIPAVFNTLNDNGELTAGERLHEDVQEAYIDTFTISTLDEVPVTVTVTVDVWNWDMMDVRLPAAFVMDLVAESAKRIQYDGSTEDLQPILLRHGDQLRWSVSEPDVAATLNCALSGWKNWSELPVLVGPKWVPGNENLA